jgi:hypothetical protein
MVRVASMEAYVQKIFISLVFEAFRKRWTMFAGTNVVS